VSRGYAMPRVDASDPGRDANHMNALHVFTGCRAFMWFQRGLAPARWRATRTTNR